jgi:predicted phosphodiesterase
MIKETGLVYPDGSVKSKEEIQRDNAETAVKAGVEITRNIIYPNQEEYDLSGRIGNPFKFGIISDTHLASKQERLHELDEMYEKFKQEGIDTVFHCGDIVDGYGVYRGQEFEVKVAGQDEQIDYAVAQYPKVEGIDTYFITGNHCLRQYERGGVDPGKPINQRRPDLKYLGQMKAKVRMADDTTMELLHPDGAVAYALSYKAQRAINNLTADNVPDIMAWGHYHTSFYMNYRDINFLQVPCFKGQGLWEARKGLNPTIGGWIVEGKIDDGTVTEFNPTLFKY